MIKNILATLLVFLIITSCFKKDEMIPAHEPGELTTVVIPMTMYYSNQVYFNLERNEMTGINDREVFDLNFDCDDTSTIIRLNTANFARAGVTNFENLEDVNDTTGLNWLFDGSSGDIDSLAIDGWINIVGDDTTYSNKVFVINRGFSSLGIQLGLIKVKFTQLKSNKYYFTYSKMDNSGLVVAAVEKNNLHLYTQYSFVSGTADQVEPLETDWDLLFTTYTTMLYTTEGDAYPYLVNGVLQKYNKANVAFDTTLVFNEITLADTASLDFSYSFDKIGYNWKKLIGDVNTGNVSYEINVNYNYIVKDRNSYYYKLRFVNFYKIISYDPLEVEKGYPTFEYQLL
ncbi:MAG: hypothetical protein HQ521_06745 [Bacteroidetes bacterium]|nr:hypothetical protein [Bacteroidota bacterium]